MVTAKTLLLLDRGFYHFQFFAQLISQQVDFITRLKVGAAVKVVKVFTSQPSVKDQLIQLGTGRNGAPILTLRLVEIRFGKTWYSYITSVLAPVVLPPYVVADLYRGEARIEEAFNTVKRLLGLSYLWTGSINGVKLQGGATWLFYAVLVDLGDAVAEELALPFERISLQANCELLVAIESLIRQVVNLRLKGTGKFWLLEHAEIMLHARCQWAAGTWGNFCDSILTAMLYPA